ncbi:hypothetical protein PR001_g10077 [Phytophthora rubi]|uniref:Secreted protein n=1 Tax=Phytophthora rubi TaxID=129364 RepID=A0A6A3MWP1_9STRA|nr:hypothetical protein PR001_g10077 [Phytophthora rubi]
MHGLVHFLVHLVFRRHCQAQQILDVRLFAEPQRPAANRTQPSLCRWTFRSACLPTPNLAAMLRSRPWSSVGWLRALRRSVGRFSLAGGR